jgi:hypothetical protein
MMSRNRLRKRVKGAGQNVNTKYGKMSRESLDYINSRFFRNEKDLNDHVVKNTSAPESHIDPNGNLVITKGFTYDPFKKVQDNQPQLRQGSNVENNGVRQTSTERNLNHNTRLYPGSGQVMEENIVDFDGMNSLETQKGGSIPGMFAIPMGVYNRYQDEKKEFDNRIIRQNEIKMNKRGYNSLEDYVQQTKINPSEIEANKLNRDE